MTKVAESRLLVGLDIGTSKVVAVLGEVKPDGVINVLSRGTYRSRGIERGGVVDLDAAVKSIEGAISEAESMMGEENCEIKVVILSISGHHITALNEAGTVPLSGVVTEDDIDSALHLARSVKLPDGLEMLHIIPQDYQVDYLPATKNPLGLSGMRLKAQAHLISCHQDWERNLVNAVEQAKLKIEDNSGVVFSGLASSYSVLTEDEKELGVCLIDFGAGTMDIMVYTDGALRFSKVLPWAGNNVTDYLASAFSTTRAEAESIKVKYGSAISPPSHNADQKVEVIGLAGTMRRGFTRAQVAEVTSRCYTDLFKSVQHELLQLQQELFQKGIKHDLIAGFVLTGGGSQIEDVVKCAENVFGSHVRVGYPLNIEGLTDYVNKPQYATVLGLLQYNHHNTMAETKIYVPKPVKGFLDKAKELASKSFNLIKKSF